MNTATHALERPALGTHGPSASRTHRAAAVWGMLALRPVLAVVFQSALALALLLVGSADPWRAAADWWLAWFALVSVVNLVVLRALLPPSTLSCRCCSTGGSSSGGR